MKRRTPWRFSPSSIGMFGTGGWPGFANVTASGGRRQSRPCSPLHRACARLRGTRVGLELERVLLRLDHGLDAVVVRLEVGAADRPVLAVLVHEPLLVLPEEHVRVDDRAAAQAAGDECLDALEAPDVEEAVEPLARSQKLMATSRGLRGNSPGAHDFPRSSRHTDFPPSRRRWAVTDRRSRIPRRLRRNALVCSSLEPPLENNFVFQLSASAAVALRSSIHSRAAAVARGRRRELGCVRADGSLRHQITVVLEHCAFSSEKTSRSMRIGAIEPAMKASE